MADFLTLISRMRTDMALLHDIIHGAVDQTVATEGGDVPTAASVLAELQAQADALAGLQHNALNGRDGVDAHPMDAITGLVVALAGKADSTATADALAARAVLAAANVWPQAQRYAETALATDAGVVEWDMQAVPTAVLTLTENVTSIVITNLGPGELKLVQDATGGWSVAWPASILWPGGVAPSVTPNAGAVDVLTFSETGGNLLGMPALDFKVVA